MKLSRSSYASLMIEAVEQRGPNKVWPWNRRRLREGVRPSGGSLRRFPWEKRWGGDGGGVHHGQWRLIERRHYFVFCRVLAAMGKWKLIDSRVS